MSTKNDVSLEIQSILDNNELDDLKRFLSKRRCLNASNSYLIYLFNFVQSLGILTTSYAAGNNNATLIWVGISLNFVATLISIYEKTNSSILKKLMADIKLIKEGNYVDEGELIDLENLTTSQPIPQSQQNKDNSFLSTGKQAYDSIDGTNT